MSIVTEIGVDSLRDDPLTLLDWTLAGLERFLIWTQRSGTPWLALGGGGYRRWNVIRGWTLVWARMIGAELPDRRPVGDGPGAPSRELARAPVGRAAAAGDLRCGDAPRAPRRGPRDPGRTRALADGSMNGRSQVAFPCGETCGSARGCSPPCSRLRPLLIAVPAIFLEAQARRSLEAELAARLESVAAAASQQIDPSLVSPLFSLGAESGARTRARLNERLTALMQATGVRRIYLLDLEGRDHLDTDPKADPGIRAGPGPRPPADARPGRARDGPPRRRSFAISRAECARPAMRH